MLASMVIPAITPIKDILHANDNHYGNRSLMKGSLSKWSTSHAEAKVTPCILASTLSFYLPFDLNVLGEFLLKGVSLILMKLQYISFRPSFLPPHLSCSPPSFSIPSLFSSFLEGLNRGTSITLKHFIFRLCNMKQLTWLNFRHFNSYSKKFFETVNFFSRKKQKRLLIFLVMSRSFRPFYDNSELFQKISQGYQRFPKTIEDFRRLTKTIAEDVRRTLQTLNSIFFGNRKH